MKKYIFASIVLCFFTANTIYAQKLIARQSGSTTTFHTTLDDAITQANNDDILYIPGGYFDLTVPITKKLHLIGEGHNPNYSKVNGNTTIGGSNLILKPEANGSTFQGIFFNLPITLEVQVKNIFFHRCNIYYIASDADYYTFREYISLTECVVRLCLACPMQYGEFNNCIFQGYFSGHFRSCNFKNSIFLYANGWCSPGDRLCALDFSRYEKCIFLCGGIFGTNCYFYDNILIGTEGNVVLDGTYIFGNNNKFMPQEMIFEDQSGNAFNYEHNYHQKNEPTDVKLIIGIHGGQSPWKENCFPMNPQILEKNISTFTNPDGTLDVNIKVEAQQK